jgi:undecaprenyl-diphosphatase
MDVQASKLRPGRRYLLLTTLFILGLYVLLPQIGDFKSSWHLLGHPAVGWVLLALMAVLVTYLAAAGTYYFLAFKRLMYGRTLIMQLAAMFINRLLPSGIGALGTNYIYLRRNDHSGAEAATVVGVNNLLGFIGHNIVFWVTLVIFASEVTVIKTGHTGSFNLFVKYLVIIIALLLVSAFAFGRHKVKKALNNVSKQLLEYRHRPWRLAGALATSVALTLANVYCLYASAHALGIDLPFAAVFIVFTFGIGAATATPTPGGLGGFEAGLVAGFVAYHVASAPALAAALLFRLISYWLALLIGAAAFVVAGRRHYI